MYVKSNAVDRAAKVEQFVRASAFEQFLYGLFEEADQFMLYGIDDGDGGDAIDMTGIYNGLSGGLLSELWPDDVDLKSDEYQRAAERIGLLTANLFLVALSETETMRHEAERYLASALAKRAPKLAEAVS